MAAPTIEELQGQVQRLSLQLEQAGGMIQGLQATVGQQNSQIQQLAASTTPLPSSPTGREPTSPQRQSLIDTRVLGKPDTFKGEQSKWTDWCFVLKSYLCAIDGRYQAELQQVEEKFKVAATSPVFTWMVRHASWLLTRYLVKSDGRTSYERLRGKPYRGEIAEAMEHVFYLNPLQKVNKLDDKGDMGIWLGKSLGSDEHLIGTTSGIRRCRSVWRKPDKKRWNLEALTSITCTPWQPRGEARLTDHPEGRAPRATGERGVYITLDRQYRHGQTPGCPGCFAPYGEIRPHNAECRKRFTVLIEKETEEKSKKESLKRSAGESVLGEKTPLEESGGQSSGSKAARVAPPAEVQQAVREAPPAKAPQAVRTAPPPEEIRAMKAARLEDPWPGDGGDTEMLDPNAGLVGGLTTMHEPELIASIAVDEDVYSNIVDEKTGEWLEFEEVLEGINIELKQMEAFSVKQDITVAQAREMNLKIVNSRWIFTRKPRPGRPKGVRARCVAQEINYEKREDVSMCTPPLKTHRIIVSLAASKGPRRLIARYDVSVAFFHAPATLKIAVKPPKGIGDADTLWWLQKAMNGTREASKQWGGEVARVAVEVGGFSESKISPLTFYTPSLDITFSCHGDDFLAEGEGPSLDVLDKMMVENFETKVLPRIGPKERGGEVSSGKHLKRTIAHVEGFGFTWEGDPVYAEEIVKGLGLERCKGSDLPATKGIGSNVREADDFLDEEMTAKFRHLTGMALYASLDRPTIQFAVSEIARGMSQPKVIDELKLRKLAKYLKKNPREIWLYEYQTCPGELWIYTDSDWATDEQTRRSMSCSVERFGKHIVESSCGRQSLVALSSAEAEFYSMIRGAASGIQTQQIFEELGVKLKLVMKCDSSAARGIASRNGSGKVKHLGIKDLWIQQAVRSGEIYLDKVDTLLNWSDIGTKALPAERLHSLVSQMPLKLVAVLTAVSAKAQGGQECRADDTGEWSTVLLVFGVLLALAFMCGRWSATAWSPPEVQAIPSGGTHPTDDRPSLLMTRERGEWARATRGAPLAQQALTSATGEGSERSESGSVNPASGYELRGEILSRYSLDELKEIGRRLNVFCDDDKEAVVSHLRLAWYEGSIEVLAYLHEAMVRSCSRPNVTDLLNSHVMVQWILEEDQRRCDWL